MAHRITRIDATPDGLEWACICGAVGQPAATVSAAERSHRDHHNHAGRDPFDDNAWHRNPRLVNRKDLERRTVTVDLGKSQRPNQPAATRPDTKGGDN
jgi:hypothetical protein